VKITWDVSDKEVISVANDGLVTAKAVGEATVWAASGNVQSKKVTVKVTLKALTSFTVTPNSLTNLKMGDAPVQLVVTKTPADAGGSFTYTSDDDAIAEVDADGMVTAKGIGTTNVVVTSGALPAVTVQVTVTPPALTSLTVTPEAINVAIIGATVPITAVDPVPPQAVVGTLAYDTDNASVATVSTNGVVTITGAGNANITVTSGDIHATVPVTVTIPAPDASFNKAQWTVTASDVWQSPSPTFAAEKLIDGDELNHWHSTPNTGTGVPVTITVDMKGNKSIEGFYLIHRPETNQPANPKAITIEVSIDAETWVPVYQTDDLSQEKTAILLNLEQTVVARYFKVTITATNSGDNYTYLAEIGAYNDEEPYEPPVVESGPVYTLSFDGTAANNITLTPGEGFVTISTTGSDPNIGTTFIGRVLGGTTAKLRFEYKSNQTVTNAEFFWCVAGGPEGGKSTGESVSIPQGDDWTPFEYDLATAKSSFGFGSSASHFIRFDPTGNAGYEITIRNLRIETDEE
jgi:uncharacterized protein YjdB